MTSKSRLTPPGLLSSALALCLCWGHASAATNYQFFNLGTLGGTNSSAVGVNNAGQIVGNTSTTGNSSSPVALWSNGGASTLTTPFGDATATAINAAGQVTGNLASTAVVWTGTTPTYLYADGFRHTDAQAINSSGQVAGYGSSSGPPQAMVWNGGTATVLGTSEIASYAAGINDAGQVVGNSYGAASLPHATLWNGGVTTDLGTLGGDSSFAYAINQAGLIVGEAQTAASASHAALWNGSEVIDLGTLGGVNSLASATNSAGLVVGASEIASSSATRHATVWDGHALFDLNDLVKAPAWELLSASGINDQGWIVGSAYFTASNQIHGFLLIPVPEPETGALLLAGLTVLGLSVRRRPVGRSPNLT